MTGAVIFIDCHICRRPIPVDQQLIENAAALGTPLRAAHTTCTGQAEPVANPQRMFRAQVIIYEIEDPDLVDPEGIDFDFTQPGTTVLAGVGHTLRAEGFAEAVNGPFATWLERQWQQLQESAHLADQPTGGTL